MSSPSPLSLRPPGLNRGFTGTCANGRNPQAVGATAAAMVRFTFTEATTLLRTTRAATTRLEACACITQTTTRSVLNYGQRDELNLMCLPAMVAGRGVSPACLVRCRSHMRGQLRADEPRSAVVRKPRAVAIPPTTRLTVTARGNCIPRAPFALSSRGLCTIDCTHRARATSSGFPELHAPPNPQPQRSSPACGAPIRAVSLREETPQT
jgi:hypothetical protein